MNVKYLAATMMTTGLLMAAPAFAQSTTAQKQHTQEGGTSESFECGSPLNANPAADPDCKHRTPNLTASPFQVDATGKQK